MTRRSRTTTNEIADLEGTQAQPLDPGVLMPRAGVPVTAETKLRWDANAVPQAPDYGEDLRQLAEDETDNLPEPEPELDPLSSFCQEWQRFAGYSLKVVRFPDPPSYRPGTGYNRPCIQIESLGYIQFYPMHLEQAIQELNGNSGGIFRLFLTDTTGAPIPGASVSQVAIGDPPRRPKERDPQPTPAPQPPQYQAPPAPVQERQLSAAEIRLQDMQDKIFEQVLMRALNPPPPPAPPDPLAQMDPETRIAYDLLKSGNMLPNVIERLSNLAQSPEKQLESSWKDKAVDMIGNVVTERPEIVPQLLGVAVNGIKELGSVLARAFVPNAAQIITAEPIIHNPANAPSVVHHPPAQRANPQVAPVPPRAPSVNGLEETDQASDHDLDQDDPEDIMMQAITEYLMSEKPINLQDKVFKDLQLIDPGLFAQALGLFATLPLDNIINYIGTKNKFALDMLMDKRQGAYLRQRLQELQDTIKRAYEQAQQQQAQATQTPPAQEPAT